MPKWPSLTLKFFEILTCRFWKNDNFPPTWTICISKKSWNHSKFIFASKKCYCVWNFLKKMDFKNFIFQFSKEKNFDRKFFENFFTTPKFFFLEWFKTPKMEIAWRFGSPDAIQDIVPSSQSCGGQIPPTPGLIRVNLSYQLANLVLWIFGWEYEKNIIASFDDLSKTQSIKNTKDFKVIGMYPQNRACNTHFKLKIEKGVADLIFKPHPPNFHNQYNFWRCLNYNIMTFWHSIWFPTFKKIQKHSCPSLKGPMG